jgi:uncharacterized protein (TIGR02996 family)
MTSHQSFIKTICSEPDNMAPRLVYADWLDEQDEHDAALAQRNFCAAYPTIKKASSKGFDKWHEAKRVLEGANACKEHQTGLSIDNVLEVIAAFEGCHCRWRNENRKDCDSYCDRAGMAILLLKDGRFAVVWEDEDTSGHG